MMMHTEISVQRKLRRVQTMEEMRNETDVLSFFRKRKLERVETKELERG